MVFLWITSLGLHWDFTRHALCFLKGAGEAAVKEVNHAALESDGSVKTLQRAGQAGLTADSKNAANQHPEEAAPTPPGVQLDSGEVGNIAAVTE